MQLQYLISSNNVDRIVFNICGILVAAYALHVERRNEVDPTYTAACDFSERMSCSKVLTSKYGKGFGLVGLFLGNDHFLNLPNCLIGIVFHVFQITLAVFPGANSAFLLYYSSVTAVCGSVYLAYILFVVLQDFCVVCIATYIVNGALLYLNYHQYLQLCHR